MWFATSNGLYRYDSRNFKIYTHDETNVRSLSSNHLAEVYFDSRRRLWVSSSNGLNLFDREHDDFVHFFHDPDDAHSLSNNRVFKAREDSQGILWVGTANGLNAAIPEGNNLSFTRYLEDSTGQPLQVYDIIEEETDVYWLGTSQGLMRFSRKGGQVETRKYYIDSKAVRYPKFNTITTLYDDRRGNLWVGNLGGGLFRFNKNDESFYDTPELQSKDGEAPVVSGIVSDGKNGLWLSAAPGLAHFDCHTRRVTWHLHDPGENMAPINDNLGTVYKDSQGGVWTGGYYKGIIYRNTQKTAFEKVGLWAGAPQLEQPRVAQIGQNAEGQLWFGLGNKTRLVYYDKRSGRFSEHIIPLAVEYNLNTRCMDRQDIIWLGGRSMLIRYDKKTGRTKEFQLLKAGTGEISEQDLSQLMEDSQGRLWVCTNEGVSLFDRTGEVWVSNFPQHDKREGNVTVVFEDSRKNIWFGGSEGFFRLTYGAHKIEAVPSDKNPAYLRPISIHEDVNGRLWFGSVENMLQEYDPVQNRIVSHIPEDTQENFVGRIANIRSDKSGYLWMSDDIGLIRYHPGKKTMQRFDTVDGLPGNPIMRNTAFLDTEGLMYFSTFNGVFRFRPDSIQTNDKTAPVVFTDLRLFNKPVPVARDSDLLPKNLNAIKEVVFSHTQNIFTIEFALLNFIRSDKNQYAYKLEGLESDWNFVKTPTATYTNLSPGNYTLLVKGANNDGYWNEVPARLAIVVLPPWWKTWYAYLLYCVVVLLVILGSVRYLWIRNSLRKESELHQAKLDFFTNISHEIRTHLTLIGGPLQKTYESSSLDTKTKKLLAHAKGNFDSLMELVDDLLVFRKIENGQWTLRVNQHPVGNVVKVAVAAFELFSREKGIHTKTELPGQELIAWFDASQMQKVLYNLLSNAYKFTPRGGTVSISVEEDSRSIWIKIKDNGAGIDPEYLPAIFANFFQVSDAENGKNTGYGIGLALAKQIVEGHKGHLTVTSRRPDADLAGETCFTVQILKGKEHFDAAQLSEDAAAASVYAGDYRPKLSEPDSHRSKSKKYSVLLIEDNDELRAFGKEVLQEEYRILEADNGRAGIEIAREHLPDLIVSDIMMPELNGLDLCAALKSDIRTNHIPVILLTARGASYQMMQGLKAGADAYVIKPFDIRVLELKIKNLIHTREVLQHRNNPFITVEPDGSVLSDMDRQFMGRIQEIVEKNMSDPGFGTSGIAAGIGMSVSVLYRKIRALTGMTVNDYVKSAKMKHAATLLSLKTYHVNEVAYRVGFESRKHFSREFKKLYGETPSKYTGEPSGTLIIGEKEPTLARSPD